MKPNVQEPLSQYTDVTLEDIPPASQSTDTEEIIENPHLSIESSRLVHYLNAVKHLKVASKDILARSILLETKNGNLYLTATDVDIYVKTVIPLLNTTNILDGYFVLPIEAMMSILRVGYPWFIIHRDGTTYLARLYRGDMELETYRIGYERFYCGRVDAGNSDIIPVEKLSRIIRQFSGMLSVAMSGYERRLLFSPTGVYMISTWSVMRVPGTFPSMELRIRDTSIIQSLLRCCQDEKVRVISAKVGHRKELVGRSIIFSFYSPEVIIPDQITGLVDTVSRMSGVIISRSKLMKVLTLAKELKHLSGSIQLSYAGNSLQVKPISLKNTARSEMVFPGRESGFNLSRGTYVVNASLFRSILAAMDQDEVTIILHGKGVGITTDFCEAVLYTEQPM